MVIISLVSPFRKSERRRLITWVIFSAQRLCFLGNIQRVPTVGQGVKYPARKLTLVTCLSTKYFCPLLWLIVQSWRKLDNSKNTDEFIREGKRAQNYCPSNFSRHRQTSADYAAEPIESVTCCKSGNKTGRIFPPCFLASGICRSPPFSSARCLAAQQQDYLATVCQEDAPPQAWAKPAAFARSSA